MKNVLDKMLSNLYKGIWAVDANNKFIYFSKGMEDITGISEERIIGKDIKDFMEVAQLSVGDETHFTELSLQVKDKLKPTRYHSLSFLTPEGNLNLLSGHIIPMLNGSDKYTGFICTVESISEQNIREKDLQGHDNFKEKT